MTKKITPRIAYLTAGAAGMICGSCLRDNTLARHLQKLGVDITLIPTYTPIRTDEESVAIDQVFFGGINVYLQEKVPIFRWIPRWLDRVLDRPGLIDWLASRGLETSAQELGALTVSMLRGEHGHQAKEVYRLADWLRGELQPNIVNLTNILIGGSIPVIKSATGAKIVVTLQGDDLFLGDLQEPYKTEAIAQIKRIARDVDAYIVFSRYYADFMSDWLGLDRSKMRIVPLGISVDELPTPAPHRPADRPPTVGYFARICPAKGFHQIVDAFLRLKRMPGMQDARLLAAGWLGPGDRAHFDEQMLRLDNAGMRGDFEYRGVVDRAGKAQFFSEIDLFSVPTTYREPKGLFVLESLISGVPAVLPDHGAFPELSEGTRGIDLFPPGDVNRLSALLHARLMDLGQTRARGLEGASDMRQKQSAEQAALATKEVYESLMRQ